MAARRPAPMLVQLPTGDKENSIDGEGLAKMFAKNKGKRRKSSGLRSNGESKRSAVPLVEDPDRPRSPASSPTMSMTPAILRQVRLELAQAA